MNGILKQPCDEGVIAVDSGGDDSGFEHGVH